MAPPLIAGLTLAATAIGAGVTAYSSYQSGQAAKAQADYQQRVAQLNQQFSNTAANVTESITGQRVEQVGRQGQTTISTSRAAIGASGVDVAGGSARDVVSSEEALAQHDESVTEYTGEQQAYLQRVQGLGYGQTAALAGAAGTQYAIAGDIGAGGSLLGGAASVGSKWLQYTKDFPTTTPEPLGG